MKKKRKGKGKRKQSKRNEEGANDGKRGEREERGGLEKGKKKKERGKEEGRNWKGGGEEEKEEKEEGKKRSERGVTKKEKNQIRHRLAIQHHHTELSTTNGLCYDETDSTMRLSAGGRDGECERDSKTPANEEKSTCATRPKM